MEHVLDWLKANSGRIIFLAIVIALAFVVTRLLSRGLRKVLEHNKIPQASIFINIARSAQFQAQSELHGVLIGRH